jgi:hypothetical protein
MARSFIHCGSLGLFLCLTGAVAATGGEEPRATEVWTPERLNQVVAAHFAAEPGYQEGDLITRRSTERLLVQLQQGGWPLDDPASILARILPEDDFLVQQLRTPRGRKFWAKMHHLPGGIDRLDRLARMPQGRASVTDLIQRIPNGEAWIEGMVTTQRGRRLGEQLSKSPAGRGFNQPTGRIYTAEQLVAELSRSEAQALDQPH